MPDFADHDATALAALVASRQVSPGELLDHALAAVARDNPALNAVVLVQEGAARAAIARGLPQGPFRGVPTLFKDLHFYACIHLSNQGIHDLWRSEFVDIHQDRIFRAGDGRNGEIQIVIGSVGHLNGHCLGGDVECSGE